MPPRRKAPRPAGGGRSTSGPSLPPHATGMGEHARARAGQPKAMRTLTGIERAMERWTSTLWTAVRSPRPKPMEVVAVLRRECDDNALIMERGRTLVPNHFTIELPADSHRQLAAHHGRLGAELAAQVRRHAAEQRYRFAGPVTVDLHPGEGRRRYRVHSRLAPHQAPTASADLTKALPVIEAPPAPRVQGSAAGLRPSEHPQTGRLARLTRATGQAGVRPGRLPVPGREMWRTGWGRR
ncbi:DUF3662 domain-containing protein [Streptomyces sp. ODS28]|uniref:DUF3662 domain-containing protein n=1 Tax=Streptomyces sp. ODS28 TaxID=3136688 RepID=UPI0031E7B62B